MARKNGCPMSVRDWVIEIMSPSSARANPGWVRVKGLESITLSYDADTEDGSEAAAAWKEPYVTKRSGALELKGKPVQNRVTGEIDPGQALLNQYAACVGCDGDATLRLTDACGHAAIVDAVITKSERGADDSEETVSWEAEIVGEPEEQIYVQVTGIATSPANTAVVTVGTPVTVTVSFAPSGASNQKYAVASSDTGKVKVRNIDGLRFELVGIAATSEAVNVKVRSVNNAKEAVIAVTVRAAA